MMMNHLSVSEARDTLRVLRGQVGDNFKEFLEEIEKSIGICQQCKGNGFYYTNTRERGGYQVMVMANGAQCFKYPCSYCNGKGQCTASAACESCSAGIERPAFNLGEPLRVGLVTKSDRLCEKCSQKFDEAFGVKQLQPKPEPPQQEGHVKAKVRLAHSEASDEDEDVRSTSASKVPKLSNPQAKAKNKRS
jgi:hypothetical protein